MYIIISIIYTAGELGFLLVPIHITRHLVQHHSYLLSLSDTPTALRQKSSMGGSVQVGERHVPVERRLAAAGRPVAAAAEAGGRGIRRL